MNTRPLDQANNPDLRNSLPALRRAAQRARDIAVQTGTDIVVSRLGVIEHIKPPPAVVAHTVQEPSAPYERKP